MSSRPDRIIVWTYVACLVPALVASGWLYLWLQWALPTEDGKIEGPAILAGLILAGVVLGDSHRVGLTRRAAWLLRAAALFSFGRLCFWPPDFVAWNVRWAFSVPVAVGYVLGRVWAYFFTGEWWIPFVVSLAPPLLVLSLINPDTKQGWPWRSFRPQILALRVNADAALTGYTCRAIAI